MHHCHEELVIITVFLQGGNLRALSFSCRMMVMWSLFQSLLCSFICNFLALFSPYVSYYFYSYTQADNFAVNTEVLLVQVVNQNAQVNVFVKQGFLAICLKTENQTRNEVIN